MIFLAEPILSEFIFKQVQIYVSISHTSPLISHGSKAGFTHLSFCVGSISDFSAIAMATASTSAPCDSPPVGWEEWLAWPAGGVAGRLVFNSSTIFFTCFSFGATGCRLVEARVWCLVECGCGFEVGWACDLDESDSEDTLVGLLEMVGFLSGWIGT